MRAWHFLSADGMTRYAPRTKIEIGQRLSVDPERLYMCEYGLHASERIIDALQYAPGPILCRVELSGRILSGADKLCAEHRTVIAMADATQMLHEFACRQAESVLHLIPEDERHVARCAIDTKRKWLRGQASGAELDAASAAASAAARDAAWDASAAASAVARDAAWDVAWEAAREAAWAASAARAAARAAAMAAAWDVAWAAARDAAWAARDAAWAARDAAWDVANRMLTDLAYELLPEGR
jgi:hypothetical protein